MNTQSAKGERRLTWEALEEGNPGDWFFEQNFKGLFIRTPGAGITYWTITEPQENGARWHWDGNETAPTLTPSLHLVGQWHGWMRNGELISC